MRNLLSLLKPIAICLVAVAIMAFAQGVAKADEVFVTGYSNGCFNGNVGGGCVAGVPANSSATQNASLLGLSYVNSTFSNTTVGGFMGIGGNPLAPPTQNVNNLGAFNLASSAGDVHWEHLYLKSYLHCSSRHRRKQYDIVHSDADWRGKQHGKWRCIY